MFNLEDLYTVTYEEHYSEDPAALKEEAAEDVAVEGQPSTTASNRKGNGCMKWLAKIQDWLDNAFDAETYFNVTEII